MGGDSPSAADFAVYGIAQSVENQRAGKLFEENQEFFNWMKEMQQSINSPKGLSYAKS